MNLEHFIQHLLYHFDCVIIPNFGGMVAQPVAASVNLSQHIFYAPKKQLAFNRNLDKSDGLLVNHVALNMNISYSEASNWVEGEVKKWKSILAESGKLNMAEVGQFKLDKDQNIQFEPASFVNYQIESFGFTSFHVSPVNPPKPEPIYKVKDKPKFVKTKVEKTKEPFKINFKKILPYAVALPLLAAMIYVPTQTSLLKNTKVYYSNLVPFSASQDIKYSERISVALPALPAVEASAAVNSAVQATAETSTNKVVSEPVIEHEVKTEKLISKAGKVHLIVGAFSSEDLANSLISELNAKGFHAYLQGRNSTGLYRVSCNSFTNKSDATIAKAELPSEMGAWILAE
jgi:cell division septation protein DedD